MRLLWRVLLVAIAVVIAWRVVTLGLARHYADQLVPGDRASIDRVLAWAPQHPLALFEHALTRIADDPDATQRLLGRAYEANPTNALPLIVLAGQLQERGEVNRADALIEIANGLEPVDPFVQKQIALYWDQRERPEQALIHLSTVMESDTSERGQIFPALLQIAENPQQRDLLRPFAIRPPIWWDGFFAFASQRASQSETLRFLYNLRRQSSSQPITAAERSAFRERLIKEGQISEAYLVWVNELDADRRRALGLLYNGGFEEPLTSQGFDWHARSSRRAEISTLPTNEAGGQRALRLSFRAFDGRFAQLWQPLYLDAGTYRLSGRVRSDDLRTQGGLRWQVVCLLPNRDLLGESARFVGGTEWTTFSFDFEVPEACGYQQLRLISAGQRSFELGIDGLLWYDDLQIARTTALDAAARADALLRSSARPSPSVDATQDDGEGDNGRSVDTLGSAPPTDPSMAPAEDRAPSGEGSQPDQPAATPAAEREP
jgi:hypothetical protein